MGLFISLRKWLIIKRISREWSNQLAVSVSDHFSIEGQISGLEHTVITLFKFVQDATEPLTGPVGRPDGPYLEAIGL